MHQKGEGYHDTGEVDQAIKTGVKRTEGGSALQNKTEGRDPNPKLRTEFEICLLNLKYVDTNDGAATMYLCVSHPLLWSEQTTDLLGQKATLSSLRPGPTDFPHVYAI